MKAGDKVRATIGFILFDQSSFIQKEGEIITFAQLVRDGFEKWTNKKNDWLVRFTYNEICNKEPDSETFVFWKQDRNKFTAALILHALIPFYKFRTDKKDKHGELILEFLDCLLYKEIDKNKIKDLDLEYYWHNEFTIYLKKAFEVLDMTDLEFANLDNFDDWLNT